MTVCLYLESYCFLNRTVQLETEFTSQEDETATFFYLIYLEQTLLTK